MAPSWEEDVSVLPSVLASFPDESLDGDLLERLFNSILATYGKAMPNSYFAFWNTSLSETKIL